MAINFSLKALRAFESAARTGSFVQAADELSISAAAISQLIRSLEQQVGRQLFHRVNRSVVVSEAGLEILPHVSKAFEEINWVSQKLSGRKTHRRLVISVPHSVAMGWLASRIPAFTKVHGQIDFSLRGEDDPISFENDLIDMRMSYGKFFYPDYDTEEILTDVVFPACSPAFMKKYGPFKSETDFLSVPLIHTDWGPSSAAFPSWMSWFKQGDQSIRPNPDSGLIANYSKAAINLAQGDLGIVLAQGMLISGNIKEGTLVRAFDRALKLPQPYCITIPRRSQNRELVLDFKAWLVKEMQS